MQVIQINPILVLLFGELLLLTTVVSVVLIALAIVRKREGRAAARKLVSNIKKDEARRQEETKKIIQEQYGLQNEQQEDLYSKISMEEKRFYQTLINLYLKRDATALETLHIAFHGATEPYRSIALSATTDFGESDIAVDGAKELSMEHREAEIERLVSENQQLSEELKTTMETMGRMLKEYATMYGGEDNPPEAKQIAALMTEQEIEQEEAPILSEQSVPVLEELSEIMGEGDKGENEPEAAPETAPETAIDESARLDQGPENIDHLIDDVAVPSDIEAEAVEKGSENQTQAQENMDQKPVNGKDNDLDDLEVMPEDDELLNLSGDEVKK